MIPKIENIKNEEYLNIQNCANLGLKNFQENFSSNKINKNLKNNIHISEESTVNTIINSHKNKKQKNYEIEFNQKNLDIITENINKPFEALEKLLLNDSNKEMISINNNSFAKNDFIENDNKKKIHMTQIKDNIQNKINLKSKQKSKSISIPKLDFSMILDYYRSNKIIVKEIKMDNIKDYDDIADNNILENIKKHHHKHHKHHYNFHHINL